MEYSANSIDFLKGLETVRKRPTMYIGAVSGNPSQGLYRLLREAIDNAIDEYLAGFNNVLYIFYNTKTKETTVLDNGRGIPVGWNDKAQQDSLTLVFTQLHAGGKFDKQNYATSSGLNGIGQKAIAALSTKLQVWSNNAKDKKWHTQTFEKGKITSEVEKTKLPEKYTGLIKKTGTIVSWIPDGTIFTDGTDLDIHRLKHELSDIQYLCPNLEIHLIIDDVETTYFSQNGLVELVSKDLEHDTIFSFQDDYTDVVLNFTKRDGYSFKSFVNVCYTDQGGTHLNGLKKALCNFVKANSKKKILPDDIMEGIVGAIHHKMAEPQYQGQTKNELTNTSVEGEIIDKLTPAFEKFFKKNKELLKTIVDYAETRLAQRERAKADKDMAKGLNALNKAAHKISDKFLDADRRKFKNPLDCELFIVEGDSAGGHFSKARVSNQACLKIRGKIINAEKASNEDLFGKKVKKGEKEQTGNREIKDLVAALGCGVQENYNEYNLRFGKVIILADSDVDGSHIQCLVLSFFVNYMPELIKNGHLYIIDAPLFIASSAKNKVYGMTRAEVDSKMKKLGSKDYTLLRMKGWGETNPEQLNELCLNPESRHLMQLKWTDNLPEVINKIMGAESTFRKELLGIN